MVTPDAHVTVRDLDMAYGSFVIQRNLSFTIRRGDIFIIMGGSGCGKSTLLRHLIGLIEPARGDIFYGDMGLGAVARNCLCGHSDTQDIESNGEDAAGNDNGNDPCDHRRSRGIPDRGRAVAALKTP